MKCCREIRPRFDRDNIHSPSDELARRLSTAGAELESAVTGTDESGRKDIAPELWWIRRSRGRITGRHTIEVHRAGHFCEPSELWLIDTVARWIRSC